MKIPSAIALMIFLVIAQELPAQELIIHVRERVPQMQQVNPSPGVSVTVTRAASYPEGGRFKPQVLLPSDISNTYVGQLQNPPPLIDVRVYKKFFHPVTLLNLESGPNRRQEVHVQLLDNSYELRAPECFALKTTYEFLFRQEQQESGNVPRKEIQRRARLKYADGILALPNPNRYNVMSTKTKKMLDDMATADQNSDDRPRQYEELSNMLKGLFELYGMDDTFDEYVPSTWDTSYEVGGNRVGAEVKLLGTHGTYKTSSGLHRLENVDIERTDDDNNTVVISGTWRFMPGKPNEATGAFRWKIGPNGDTFNGSPNWTGTLVHGPRED